MAHAVAVLIFEKDFSEFSSETNIGENHVLKISIPTLPYTSHWESSDEIEQLVKNGDDFYNISNQRIENDTLYISLSENISARDRFFELAEKMMTLAQGASHPAEKSGKLIQLLSHLVKNYLPASSYGFNNDTAEFIDLLKLNFLFLNRIISVAGLDKTTPPPEL